MHPIALYILINVGVVLVAADFVCDYEYYNSCNYYIFGPGNTTNTNVTSAESVGSQSNVDPFYITLMLIVSLMFPNVDWSLA